MALDFSRRKLVSENHVKALIKDWLNEYYPGTWSYGPIQNGLGVHGIHDRIACVPITVTPAMIGKTIGVFVSIEAKRPGRRGEPDRGMTPAQRDNMVDIRKAHGVSLCCDGEEDLQRFNRTMSRLQLGEKD